MFVRPFQRGDEPGLAEIFVSAVREIAKCSYSEQQVKIWAAGVPDEASYAARASDGRIFLVATDHEDRLLAYGDVELDGHIDHIYCRPIYAGTGVTAALYAELESEASRKGIRRLFVEASEPARRFFLKRDFRQVERREVELNGVTLHNFRMEKWLP